MKSLSLKPWMIVVLLIALLLACTPTIKIPGIGQAGDQITPAGASEVTGPSSNDIPEDVGTFSTQADAWLAATLALRSVTLELVTTYSTDDMKNVSAQIDAAGNVHLSLPVPVPEEYAATPDAPQPGDFELFIVNGKAYMRIGAEATATPDDTYLSLLADTLSGPEGPGLWLSLVPESGFVKTGTESYGGFETTIYAINFQIEPDTLAGVIWVDNKDDALVGAELTVPEGLFFPPGSNKSGDVQISLTVQKDQVETITLP